MSALADEIRSIIAQDGPITVERFMALALNHPRYGYYITRDPFGLGGDFTTAPEISQMFGELIGLWSAEVWKSMGAPQEINLVELGPGRGTLMMDALRAARVAGHFCDAIRVHLVETSSLLRVRQRETLARPGVSVEWHDAFEHVPRGPAIIIANEFFDALPVRHFMRAGGAWHERVVGLTEDGAFAFGLSPMAEDGILAEAEDGVMLEIGTAAHQLMAQIAARITEDGGAILAIDYGHTQTSFGETLQALKAHAKADPLAEPGEADITAHVDFASLGRAAHAGGAQVFGPVTQADFLTSLGIFERAASLKKRADPRQALEIDRALLRLVSTGREMGADGTLVPGMGALFKVMAAAAPVLGAPPGFESAQQTDSA